MSEQGFRHALEEREQISRYMTETDREQLFRKLADNRKEQITIFTRWSLGDITKIPNPGLDRKRLRELQAEEQKILRDLQ